VRASNAAAKFGSFRRGSHRVRLDAPDQRDELLAAGRVHALRREAVRFAEPRHRVVRALRGDVRQHDPLERGPPLRDRRERAAHTAGADHQDLHRLSV
jgi:hypothetical protein